MNKTKALGVIIVYLQVKYLGDGKLFYIGRVYDEGIQWERFNTSVLF